MIKKEKSKPILENITNKELEAYKNILKLKDIEDIDNIIFKYKNALEDYFLEDIYDLDRLKKIINAFTYSVAISPIVIIVDAKLKEIGNEAE